MKIEVSWTDCDVLALIFRCFMDQFTLVYAQIRCQMTYFSVWVQSVPGFCVEPKILDMAQLISTASSSLKLAQPAPKPILVITLGRALLRFDQGQLTFALKFTEICAICVFHRFHDFWSLLRTTHQRKAPSARKSHITSGNFIRCHWVQKLEATHWTHFRSELRSHEMRGWDLC